jgi:3-dehydroquinate dehydratase
MLPKIKFTQLKRPLICTIISDTNPGDCIRTVLVSDYDGTDAYEMNLMSVEKRFWNEKDLKSIYTATIKPMLVCHYRWDYNKHLDMNEEERIQLLINAVKWGASGVDLEADAFDPSPGPLEWTEEAKRYSLNRNSKPRDWTTNAAAIKRQKEVIDQIHRFGGEVLMSAHTRVHLSVDQAVSMAKEMESRGADIVKVVSVDVNFDDLMDTLRSTVEIKKALKVPFIMMSHGQHSKIGRVVCPMLGSMLAFCTQPVSPAGIFPLQPPIRVQKAAWENVDWTITKDPEDQRWL